MNTLSSDVRKHTDPKSRVIDYFDKDTESYLESYKEEIHDFRSSNLQTRRSYILRLIGEQPGRVLDVGSGPGVYTKALLDRGAQCCLIDCSYRMLKVAQENGKGLVDNRKVWLGVADVDSLPFLDASFNTVLCVGVLQYLEMEELAIRELCRVTRPGGTVVISLPNVFSPLNWIYQGVVLSARLLRMLCLRFKISFHAPENRLVFRSDIPNRLFSPTLFVRKCRGTGLKVREITYHGYHFPLIPGWAFPILGPIGHWLQHHLAESSLGWWGRDFIVTLLKED